jgi:hypothetical protein
MLLHTETHVKLLEKIKISQMLHIITPLYRFDLIEKVYDSIHKQDDICWHISYSNKRELPDLQFLKNNNQIKIYPVDCEDGDTTSKRNTILSKIKDGYFCFLDDDTIFHNNMYDKYLTCVEYNFKGMIIGQQLNKYDKIRLKANKPTFGGIDTGNVISHYECLEKCVWPKTHIDGVNQKDFLFWESVFNYYGKKCGIWNQPISFYNKLT